MPNQNAFCVKCSINKMLKFQYGVKHVLCLHFSFFGKIEKQRTEDSSEREKQRKKVEFFARLTSSIQNIHSVCDYVAQQVFITHFNKKISECMCS